MTLQTFPAAITDTLDSSHATLEIPALIFLRTTACRRAERPINQRTIRQPATTAGGLEVAYGPAILKYNNVNYVTKRKDPATDGELDGLLACRGGDCKG